jgi:hypothetical protein
VVVVVQLGHLDIRQRSRPTNLLEIEYSCWILDAEHETTSHGTACWVLAIVESNSSLLQMEPRT